MKDFVKMTLSVLCAFLIVGILMFVLSVGFIGTMAVAGSASQSVSLPKSGVLVLDFNKMDVMEQARENDPVTIIKGGETKDNVGLLDALRALEIAATDPAVKFIYLRPEGNTTAMSCMEELRGAILRCREAGKPVIAYMTSITTGAYYIASAADKIYTTAYKGGTNTFVGMSGTLIFVKDLLDKLGVNVQLIRHGKYKSAGEMYVRNSASEANMEQNKAMISSLWHTYASAMAESRGITEEGLNEMIDKLYLDSNEDFLNLGLVDELFTREELKAKLADLAVEEKYEDVKFMDFTDYVAAKVQPNLKAKKKIAVIYADGQIVDGRDTKEVAGDRFSSVIAGVRADSTVRAVVFRVNSPGGSVLASEKIRDEIMLLSKDKPVVASYGEYAASGGYWVSAGCSKIFSDATTLTGSIGVFSMIPDLSGTLHNIAHVNITPVNSNEHSDMYSLMRPLDAAETACMQKIVEDIYGRFVSIVSEGRHLDPDYVDSIAHGRVWTGAEAIGIGLVDEIGSIKDAVEYASILACEEGESSDISNWDIVGYPKPTSTMELILESLGLSTDDKNVLAGTPLESTARVMLGWKKAFDKGACSYTFARMPYDIVIE